MLKGLLSPPKKNAVSYNYLLYKCLQVAVTYFLVP